MKKKDLIKRIDELESRCKQLENILESDLSTFDKDIRELTKLYVDLRNNYTYLFDTIKKSLSCVKEIKIFDKQFGNITIKRG